MHLKCISILVIFYLNLFSPGESPVEQSFPTFVYFTFILSCFLRPVFTRRLLTSSTRAAGGRCKCFALKPLTLVTELLLWARCTRHTRLLTHIVAISFQVIASTRVLVAGAQRRPPPYDLVKLLHLQN